MPVQIDEIVITTTVSPQSAAISGSDTPQGSPEEHDRMLADKILQIIREKSER